nr:unnamed protein product [Digitaria exilis]
MLVPAPALSVFITKAMVSNKAIIIKGGIIATTATHYAMLRAGGCSLKPAGGRCMRVHGYRSPDQAVPFTPSNGVKVPCSDATCCVSSPGWKKQDLMQEMSKTLQSVSSNILKRFVDTAYRFSEQPSLNELRFGKAVKDSANTNIFEHGGRAFAVSESHLPYEIDINNLNTIGPYSINGAWTQPFTSHPKKIHGSGDLVIMGTNIEKPHYVLGVISSDGERLLHKVDLKFEEGKFIHDIGVTMRYNIIMDYPLMFGISRTLLQKPFIENDMNGKSRIGVMPRFGDAESIIWFDIENHCSYHLFNCFEDGNEVVVRGCRTLGSVIPSERHRVDKSKWYGRAFLQPDKDSKDFDPSLDGILFSRPYEWKLNLESGTKTEGYITSEEVAMDFPVINDKFVGIRNKYGYAQVVDSLSTSKTGLFKFKMIAKLNFDTPDKIG